MRLPAWQRTLYIVLITQFIALAGGNLVFPFLPLYIEDLGVHDKSQVAFYAGLTSTATGVTLFIFSPLWGALADRFGRKPLLLRAYLGATFSMGLQGIAQNVWQLFILRAFQGAFVGTIPAAAALVASGTPPERVGYAMGLLQMAQFTSATAGPLIGGFLADAIGFRQTFIVTSVLFGLAGLLLVFGVQEDRAARRAPRPVRGLHAQHPRRRNVPDGADHDRHDFPYQRLAGLRAAGDPGVRQHPRP